MQACKRAGANIPAAKLFSVLMALVLAFSLMPHVGIANADTASAPGSNYKPGTYDVTVGFAVNNNGTIGAEMSSTKGSLVVGEGGSLELTVSGIGETTQFQLGSFDTDFSSDVTILSTEKAAKAMGGEDHEVITSFTASLASISSTYALKGTMLNPKGMSFNKDYQLSVDFSNVPAKEGATKIAQVPEAQKLIYNGAEQTGIVATEAYAVEGGSATDAGDYGATLTLAQGYEWADGTTEPKTIAWSIAQATLTATYAGEQINASETPAFAVDVKGFVGCDTAESLAAAGYVAPAVPAPAEINAGGSYLLTPEGGNATANYKFAYVPGTLSVAVDNANGLKPGTYTVTARMYVPAAVSPMNKNMFLTCDPSAANGLNATPPLEPASENAQLTVAADGGVTLTIPLNSNALSLHGEGAVDGATVVSIEQGAKTYTNPSSNAAATKDGLATSVTLKLDSLQAAYKLTGFGIYMAPMGKDLSEVFPGRDIYAMLNVDFSNVPGNKVTPSLPDATPDDNQESGSGNDGASGNAAASGAGAAATASDGHLRAGTYTVTSNIFMEKAATGLPMGRAYLTSDQFPPNQAVTSNATLTVDSTGRATVKVPLTIQVMNVKSLPGLDIVASEKNGEGYLTSVTVDLGVLTNPGTTITKSCTANVSLSDMVVNMAGLDREQSWAATMEVNLGGIPTTSGSTVGGLSQTGDAAASTAANIALAALAAAGVAVACRRKLRAQK